MGYGKGGYTNYRTNPRPTEFIWATNLANLLIDCVDGAAALWKELSLYNTVHPATFETHIQNFRSLVYHTSEYLHKNDRGVVKEAEDLFKSDLNFNNSFNRKTVEKALNIFERYNKRVHHTKSIMKVIEEINILMDDGK